MKRKANQKEKSRKKEEEISIDEIIDIPIIPSKENTSKEQFLNIIGQFLSVMSKISLYTSEVYAKCASPDFMRMSENDSIDLGNEINDVYTKLLNYGMVYSEHKDFVDVFSCKDKNEDIQRKSSLRTHLFWEICRLRWCLNKIRYYIYNLKENPTLVSKNKNGSLKTRGQLKEEEENARKIKLSNEIKAKYYSYSITKMGICLYPKKHPMSYSQRELGQAFFLLSSNWKYIDYSISLSKYVNYLIDRMCCFFCYSMSEEEMDDIDLRQPIPISKLPEFSNRSKQILESNNILSSNNNNNNNIQQRMGAMDINHSKRHRAGAYGGDEDDEDDEYDEEIIDKRNSKNDYDNANKLNIKKQYGPSFDFVMMSQMRFFNFLSDLALYEERDKKNMWDVLNTYYTILMEDKKKVTNIFTTYDPKSYISVDLIKRFVLDSCKHVSPEQKEKTANRYVFGTFSKTDKDWLLYKQPVNLPSFADEFISKACKDAAYAQVVERTRKTYEEILRDDVNDITLTGFYEWCVLKNASRLFALYFDIFNTVIFNREEIRESSVFIFQNKKPLIIQFFSRYYVFYKGYLFTDPYLEYPYKTMKKKGGGEEEEKDKMQSAMRFKKNSSKKGTENMGPFSLNQEDGLNERTIYHVLLLWVCIMLVDFPNSKKSKNIESVLKTKYAEYFKKDTLEKKALGLSYLEQLKRSNASKSRMQTSDEDVLLQGQLRNAKKKKSGPAGNYSESSDEDEDNLDGDEDGRNKRSERTNVHDSYFDKISNLEDTELQTVDQSLKEKNFFSFI